MRQSEKSILISAIIGYMKHDITAKNKRLCEKNLYWKQEAFDAGELFIKLAFMADDEIEKIAKSILG